MFRVENFSAGDLNCADSSIVDQRVMFGIVNRRHWVMFGRRDRVCNTS